MPDNKHSILELATNRKFKDYKNTKKTESLEEDILCLIRLFIKKET